jgi:hypothetical protein
LLPGSIEKRLIEEKSRPKTQPEDGGMAKLPMLMIIFDMVKSPLLHRTPTQIKTPPSLGEFYTGQVDRLPLLDPGLQQIEFCKAHGFVQGVRTC